MKLPKLSKKLTKTFGKTVREFDLINPNDKIIVGVSGGKDSLTLLHLIRNFQRIVPFEFEYKAVYVDYGDGIDISFLKDHCAEFDIPFEVYQTNIAKNAHHHIRQNSSYCSYFSRMRRGSLYSVCQKYGFNKLALGHHLDDAVESFFMNMFYNGTLRTLPPKYNSKYNIEVIRPLIKTREEANRFFAKENHFKTIGDETCPAFGFDVKTPYARANTKKWLKSLEKEHKELFKMIKTSFSHLHTDTFFNKNVV